MELLAIPLSRQKTAASGWFSREGGNPAVLLTMQLTCFAGVFS
jgi:hypothetical protein